VHLRLACVGDDPGLDDGEFVCSATRTPDVLGRGTGPDSCAVQRKQKKKRDQPECFLELKYRPVPNSGGYSHAYSGTGPVGQRRDYEGFPEITFSRTGIS